MIEVIHALISGELSVKDVKMLADRGNTGGEHILSETRRMLRDLLSDDDPLILALDEATAANRNRTVSIKQKHAWTNLNRATAHDVRDKISKGQRKAWRKRKRKKR